MIPKRYRRYYEPAPDLGEVKANCPNLIGYYSKNDQMIPYNQADVFQYQLGGTVFRFEDEGHFTGNQLPPDQNGDTFLKHLLS